MYVSYLTITEYKNEIKYCLIDQHTKLGLLSPLSLPLNLIKHTQNEFLKAHLKYQENFGDLLQLRMLHLFQGTPFHVTSSANLII